MAQEAPLGSDGFLQETGLVSDGAVLIDGETIVAAGPRASVHAVADEAGITDSVDLGGRCVVPGFVDPHTHPVFSGTREDEFVMRLKGRDYVDIAAAGGGILSTVSATRNATLDELVADLAHRSDRFLALGTTTIEAKSGYGLDLATELRMLEAIAKVNQTHALDLVPTFLGAHEVPAEWRPDTAGYARHVAEEMLPAVVQQGIAEFCDVFCEKGVFELEDSRRILQAARDQGLGLRVHADEIAPLGGAELCAELGAATADHLVQISDAGISALAASSTVAVALPATSLILRLERDAPVRRMIAAGCRVALATDFNPGSSWCQSMPLVIGIAAARLRMTPFEALRGATRIAAESLGRGDQIGSLAPGYQADLVVLDGPNHRHLAYRLDGNPVHRVWKRGQGVPSEPQC